LKSDVNAMSAREAAQYKKDEPALIEELEATIAGMVSPDISAKEQIISDVVGQLIAADTEQEAAETQAQIMGGLANMAERAGMDPIGLYKDVFGGVTRVRDEALNQESVDAMIDPLLDRMRAGDFPSQRDIFGGSLVDMIVKRGGLVDDGGELSARDAGQVRGLINKTRGDTLDGMAKIAAEAGFIADRDPDLLLEAIDRELRGEPVFARDADPALAEVSARMDELSTILSDAGLDIEDMSNVAVRKALSVGKTFEQTDILELNELTELVGVAMEHDPAMLAKALVSLPDIPDVQDFSGVTFTDTVQIAETGETAEVTKSAQKSFDRAVKRKNVIRKLMECVSG